jgi:biopolymer transport protein ExbD/biopolymer transport protein TolR
MSSPSGTGKNGQSSPSINITPLVDVVLVVLIIFMIVTLTMTKTFFLNLPPKDANKDEQPPPTDIKPVVMTVDKAGVIRVNQTVLPKAELEQRLPRMMAGAGQRVLYFDAHDEAAFGTAIEAMDLSRGSGVKSIAILTEKVVH